MRLRITAIGGLAVCWLFAAQGLKAAADFEPLADRVAKLLQELRSERLVAGNSPDEHQLPRLGLQVRDCRGYPYSEPATPADGPGTLIDDLALGLATGLQCLSGDGPMGRLHPYHEYQAHRLLSLLEERADKTFQCVEDAMFATAVATSPRGVSTDDPLYAQLREVRHPAVLLDTYRLGGILSRRHDDETYRAFFHLADHQIYEHRNGQPLRPANLHRYRDRAGLLFHEVVHWLGHEHSANQPDVTHLYETCCFGGSDYIDDPARNAVHQQTACAILKDDELWSEAHSPYRQMRLWHHKGYDRFKTQMRADYGS